MFQKNIIITLVVVLLSNFTVIAQTNQTQDSIHINVEPLELPENLKTIFLQEMTTITNLMGDLLEYIVQGDITNSSMIAIEIRDTNLRQESSSDEIKQIMKTLPKGFIEFYRTFHSTANELAKAVDTNDFKTAISLYSEMTQSCYNCHVTYVNKESLNLESE